MKLNCIICNKEFERSGKQAKTAKCCSYSCMGLNNRAKNNCKCTICDKEFHLKKSRMNKKYGYFCSVICLSKWRSINLKGANNPNFRNKMYDTDGSRIIWSDTFGRKKMQHAVVFELLEISKLPKGYCVHHRDCNHQNNTIENLVILNGSDHRWIHKQFGNATLWAYYYNKISLEELINWSNDKERALRLLPLNVIKQKESGVFKLDELLENLEEGNQQPSSELNAL